MQDYVRTCPEGQPVEQCMPPKGDRTEESLLSQPRYSKCWWCEWVSPELFSVLPASETWVTISHQQYKPDDKILHLREGVWRESSVGICLPQKHRHICAFSLQNPHKQLGMVVPACNPDTGWG